LEAFVETNSPLVGAQLITFDGALPHAFTFTPAISIRLDLETGEELRTLYERLGDGGTAHMPLSDHGFSQQFAWIDDRFGVSRQFTPPYGPEGWTPHLSSLTFYFTVRLSRETWRLGVEALPISIA
jgi:predicted 3-demethylubiquinone-9 3-methyltransferase (glyoxalase superfamily)